ncbi:MAG TPA: TlpA disulfide reductase family protein [Vicinamibacterales bacterium]|jgi:thiol-disulfide isomerase/thioredoxin|nr:TlpA disulfide reductase family protein [Vicinamibacterales bacterium]
MTRMRAAFVLAGIVVGLTVFSRSAVVAGAARPSMVHQQVPDIRLGTLNGGSWQMSQQRGKVVLLDFWAVYCAPCRAMEPRLKALRKEWVGRANFVIVGVPVDDDVNRVRRHVERSGMNWPQLVLPDDGAMVALVGPLGVQEMATPTLWVVDGEGRLAGSFHDLEAAVVLAKRLLNTHEPHGANRTR